jgi:oligopeptide/dipeptide ABC transporter ATP-binding protein
LTALETARAPGLRPDAERSLLCVERLHKTFLVGGSRLLGRPPTELRALEDVSFDVARGETFGLVGESGCGKSTAARCILRLHEPTAGRVVFDGVDVLALARPELRRMRRRMQIVFQESTAALDPRMSVRALVEEPLAIHGLGERAEQRERALELLRVVGITAEQAERRPHAFSGGQRQRIGVARALVLDPELVVLDEPVSAVDVSIQAQILNLLRELQQRLGLTYVFIVHDLAVAEYFCDRLAVLYLGHVMELGDRETLFHEPLHPYTVSLLSAVPIPDPALEARRRRIVLRGDVAPLGQRVGGCVFRPRCPVGRDREVCAAEEPPVAERSPGHWVACHFPGELRANGGPR